MGEIYGLTKAVFEDEAFADKATMAVEKQIHQGGDDQVENVGEVSEGQEIREKNLV